MLHSEILPQTSKNLHRLICHICDISQLCNSAPSVKMSRESDPDYLDGYWVYILYICQTGYIFCIFVKLGIYFVYLSKDGYDKAYRDAYRDYAADETAESDQESSDENSDQESSDQESDQESSDQSEDKDHKYTYKYKYKYAYKPDKPSDKDKSNDKSSDEPKDEPKDDKQTDQKYSVNTVRLWGNDSDSDSEEPIWLYGLWEETKTLPPPQPLLPNVCSCSQSFPKVSPLPHNVNLSNPFNRFLPMFARFLPMFASTQYPVPNTQLLPKFPQSFHEVSPLPYNVCNSYPMLPQSSANVPQFSP